MQAVLFPLVQNFFTQMGIALDTIEMNCQDEVAHIYEVKIQTPDSKILIGVHGQTLDHTKHLLSRMCEKIIGSHCTVHVEVNDYLKAKNERLYRYIDSKIAEAQLKETSITLHQLTSYERKKAHDYIGNKNISGIVAQSEGEGEERRLHINYQKSILPTDFSEDGI